MANNTLSQYETGKREPKLETWKKLADFFDVSVLYLQGFIDSDMPNNCKLDFKKEHKLGQEINDKTKNMIADGFRLSSLAMHKYKGGNKGKVSDLFFYGEDDDSKDLNELYMLPVLRLHNEKLQLKGQVDHLKDKNKALESKNAKLEGELSAYRQLLKSIFQEDLEKITNDKKQD